MQEVSEQIAKFFLAEGASVWGVADIAAIKKDFGIKQRVLDNINKAICFGIRLSDAIIEEIEGHPSLAYYHHYRRVNNLLDNISLKLTNFIQDKNFYAYPVPASLIRDWQKQTADVSHKHVAVLAGLGWIGRNNLLVTDKVGSRMRFATVLTNMPLKTAHPLTRTCGNCTACIKSCPAGAIKMKQEEFDHIGCFEKLKEFRNKGYAGQYICGICVKACSPAVIRE